jgi:hypothetical protein
MNYKHDLFTRSALFWDITQRRVVILYRHFGTTYRSHLQESRSKSSWTWPLKMGPISCPETSVKVYHSTLRNIPKERRSHQPTENVCTFVILFFAPSAELVVFRRKKSFNFVIIVLPVYVPVCPLVKTFDPPWNIFFCLKDKKRIQLF